jgi:hypothetical protein
MKQRHAHARIYCPSIFPTKPRKSSQAKEVHTTRKLSNTVPAHAAGNKNQQKVNLKHITINDDP